MSHRRHKTPITYVLVVLGALAVLWWGLGFASHNDKNDEERKVNEQDQILDERGDEVTPPPNNEQPVGAVATNTQVEAILNIEENSNAYLPESRTTNPIARVWFTDDSGMYVEYYRNASNNADRTAFFGSLAVGKDIHPVRLALYGQSEAGGWELMEGEDVLFTNPQKDLYERNANGEWIKIN